MVTFRRPGYVCTDHVVTVPLDHARPDGATIEVYAREVVAPARARDDLPWLLYLQGGPGHRAPRPGASAAAWLDRALRDYRVLLLDQRGTGRSTPANRRTLPADPARAADYLAHFRADAIVRDAEVLRRRVAGDRPWTVLGQSFGGFCAVTYLSIAPEGMREAIITGGLPSLTATADEVYRAAYPRVLAHNERYFARYPGDEALAARVASHLAVADERLPTGERLTPHRFQTLGLAFGSSAQFDTLHYLLEEAFCGRELSDTFLTGVQAAVSFAPHPLYAVLHEAIYAQGAATDWAAHRVRDEFPAFALTDGPVRFTGEMIYPWHFTEDPALRPLRTAAGLLAARTDWPALYDEDVLATNTVPVAAAIYHDDMYVDREASLRTAATIRDLRPWITSTHAHNALSADPSVLTHLLAILHDEI
ncbi:alpha/beta fold hydrolase [Actinomadura flavalba]|uniref:alpha/beta fold hydrolase n=1 Tax=Actinomadura flavalba TaxID=1120938 RepID=UPI00036E0825|nr:alpha/beta fold hydrolase [Actinomadura flavalba]